MSFLVPSFGDYIYYFEMDIVGFTRMQYALLMMFGFVTLISGSMLFNYCFKEINFRVVVLCGVLINLVGSVLTLCFVRQIYFGMDPMLFVICTSTVTDTLSQSFLNLPSQVLFAKLIPENIESSMFALLTGLLNFNSFISP